MKKLLIASLVATLALTACNQQQAPTSETKAPAAQESTNTPTATEVHDEHEHHEHEGEHHEDHETHEHDGHEHDGHSHAAHDHHHDDGKPYNCDNGKTVKFVVHNHEGEIEAHLTVDDIVYDLHPDTNNANAFTTSDGIQNNTGMIVKNNGNNLDVNTWSQDKGEGTALFSCKAQ